MSENSFDQGTSTQDRLPSLLSPEVCAVAGFALAVITMLGQNAMTVGVSALYDAFVDDPSSDVNPFYYQYALATLAQAAIAGALAWRARIAAERWVELLARAALVVAAVAVFGALLMLIGGWAN